MIRRSAWVALALAIPCVSRAESAEPAPTELPAALDQIHDLESRLQIAERELARLGRTRDADVDLHRAIDELRVEMDELNRRLARRSGEGGTDDQAATPERQAQVAFGYDRGLFLRLPGLEFTLLGLIQPRYTGTIRVGQRSGSDLDLHHAELIFEAAITRLLAFRAQLDFGSSVVGSTTNFSPVRDFWIDVRPTPWLTLRAGQLRVPFARQRMIDDALLTFSERALATRALAPDRDLGALAEVRFFGERLVVQVAVTDGINMNSLVHNDNLDLAYSGRVVLAPLGPLFIREGDPRRTRSARFSVGGAFLYNLAPTALPPPLADLDQDGRVDNIEVLSAAGELAAVFGGFALEGEYFFLRERAGGGQAVRRSQGGYVQSSAMIWRGLQVGARFSYAQSPTLPAMKIGLQGDSPAESYEANAIANWYLGGDRIKAQLEYSYRRDREKLPTPAIVAAHLMIAQLQVGF